VFSGWLAIAVDHHESILTAVTRYVYRFINENTPLNGGAAQTALPSCQ
jgi:hypothetical protein